VVVFAVAVALLFKDALEPLGEAAWGWRVTAFSCARRVLTHSLA